MIFGYINKKKIFSNRFLYNVLKIEFPIVIVKSLHRLEIQPYPYYGNLAVARKIMIRFLDEYDDTNVVKIYCTSTYNISNHLRNNL